MIWVVAGITALVALGLFFMLRSKTAPAGSARRSSATGSRAAGKSSRKPSARSSAVTPAAKSTRAGRWAAVSIRPGAVACAEAVAKAGTRHLEAEAPLLPLEHCNCRSCQCTFEHHADRRQKEADDRRLGVGLISELYHANDEPERRRKRRGRRNTDHT